MLAALLRKNSFLGFCLCSREPECSYSMSSHHSLQILCLCCTAMCNLLKAASLKVSKCTCCNILQPCFLSLHRLVYLLAVLHMFCMAASTRAPPGRGDFLFDILQSTRRSRKSEAVWSLKPVPFLKGREGRGAHLPFRNM